MVCLRVLTVFSVTDQILFAQSTVGQERGSRAHLKGIKLFPGIPCREGRSSSRCHFQGHTRVVSALAALFSEVWVSAHKHCCQCCSVLPAQSNSPQRVHGGTWAPQPPLGSAVQWPHSQPDPLSPHHHTQLLFLSCSVYFKARKNCVFTKLVSCYKNTTSLKLCALHFLVAALAEIKHFSKGLQAEHKV